MASKSECVCDCQKSFKTPDDLKKHWDSKVTHLCPICCSEFSKLSLLEQHAGDKKHNLKGGADRRRQTYVSNLYQLINISADDRKKSMEKVRDTMTKIMAHVRGQPGGKIYSADLRKAGSHAAKLKIGKADEFDWNVNLDVAIESVRTEGMLFYLYEDKLTSAGTEVNS